LVSFLRNDGAYTQPLGGAIQRRGSDNIDQPIPFEQLVALMFEEAGGVEEKTRRDPNQPQPEPALHLMSGGGSKSWGLTPMKRPDSVTCPSCGRQVPTEHRSTRG
jgi:hypothetical protein